MKRKLALQKQEIQNNLITSIAKVDLYELSEKEIQDSTTFILENLNRKKLRKAILDAIEDLSGVSAPNLVANPQWIAMDNQKRLEIIYKLLSTLRYIEKDFRIFRTKRNQLDTDHEFQFLSTMQDLCKGIVKYAELKHTEVEDQMYQPNLLDIMNGITTKEQKKQLKLEEQRERKLLGGK